MVIFISLASIYVVLVKTRKREKDITAIKKEYIPVNEIREFCSLFENIRETCLYAFEFEDQKDAMPEDTFRDSIQKIFFKIQKYSDEG